MKLIDTQGALNELFSRNWNPLPDQLALDLEADFDHFHYGKKVCLIQFFDGDEAYLIDPQAVPDISPVLSLIENTRVVKVMYSADGDIMLLKETHGCHLKNVWDIQIAALHAGNTPGSACSLPALSDRYLHKKLVKDSQLQKSDWTKRPLTAQQLQYAANDVLPLLSLREKIEEAIPQKKEKEFLHRMKTLEAVTFKVKRHPWRSLKEAKTLTREEESRLKYLYLLREVAGRENDLPVFQILSHSALIDLSRKQNLTPDSIVKHPKAHPCFQHYTKAAALALEAAHWDSV